MRNWNGTVGGIEHGDQRNFDDLDDLTNVKVSPLSVTPASPPRSNSPSHSMTLTLTQIPPLTHVPFAIIDVAKFSPAHEAGYHTNDRIVQFGSITGMDTIAQLPKVVSHAAEHHTDVAVTIVRMVNGEPVTFVGNVFPRRWMGNGLLGCHIRKVLD